VPALTFSLAAGEFVPDARLLFLVNLATVIAVVVFAVGVVVVLQRRSYERRLEQQKLAAMGIATARILHQVKNPLQTIVLHADLLQDEQIVGDPASRRDVSDAIVGEAQRLTAMLAELATYASGSSRQLALSPYPLHEMIQELAQREGRDESLRVEIQRLDEVVVHADPYYLHQAIDNLVSNARDAMADRPERRLSFRLEKRGAVAELTVADTGSGISPERLATIFTPFLSAKTKGMGLGLAICKEIVEAHGGRVEAQSQEGVGTQFRVYLPLATGVPLEHASPLQEEVIR
jgi:two-component system, NtrC family, C4-dicarboxylate transport sensor histidine kinase DctB